jgi:hypothetical protein
MNNRSTSAGTPIVWIVLLNWNGLDDTLECLRSLDHLRYPSAHVLVVDNGSTRDDVGRIREVFPRATVLRNFENLGYAGGNNMGIRVALRNGADYVWLLNNDTVVDPDCLAALVAAGEKAPKVGLLSPVIYDYAAPHAIQFCGTFLDRDQQRHHVLTPTSLEDARGAAEVGPLLLWGTALLLKRALVDAIGLLDERYFAYHEDLDYSLRALAAGFEGRVVPEGAVFHKTSRALGSMESPLREYLVARNWCLLWHSHPTARPRPRHWRGSLVWAMERALEASRSGQRVVAEHTLDGIWDACRGRWGSWEGRGEMPRPLKRLVLDGLLAWHPYAWMTLLAEGPLEALRKSLGRRRAH